MSEKKRKNIKPVWWNILDILILSALSAFVLNGAQGAELYSALALIFLFSGILLKRTCIFLGILIFVLVLVFTVKDSLGINENDSENNGFNFNFFINSNR